MTVIAVKPLFLKEVDLKVGTDNYEQHVSAISFVPTPAAPTSWSGLGGNTHTDSGNTTTWVCNAEYAQDWDTPNSFSQYLMDHAGERVPVELSVDGDSDPWYADITLVPGPIGGTGQAYSTGSVSMASSEPTRTPPAQA